MRGPLLPRAPLGALLPPLLLLLAATLGTTRARPHATDAQDVAAAPLTHSFYQPGAWRPVVRPSAADGAAFAPRSAAAQPPLVSSVASRVRVEDSNRSGRVDVKPPSSASTAAGTSTAATQRSTAAPAATTTVTTPSATSAAPTTASAAASFATTKAAEAQLGAAIHRVTSQLLTAEDVRTPPKLRHQQEQRAGQGQGQGQGQGVAVPVILEEDELERAEEVLTRHAPSAATAKPHEEGLSTWVLLSGSHASTPTAAASTPTSTTTQKPKPTPRPAPKRPAPPPPKRPAAAAATPLARKPSPATTTPKPTPAPTTPTAKKNASTYDAPLAPAMTRKPPTTVHRASTTTTTTTPAATTTTTTATTTTTTSTTAAPLEDEAATVLPTATEPTDTDGEEGKTEAETATRRTRRPGSGSGGGKKKKNKNKRRKNRPGSAGGGGANGTALAESKVGEQADDGALANGTRPAHAKDRPLTTRIYNYLAREVMPSFGVGLLGLAITAGLAGLIMYPFGGGAAKRTYEVDAPALPSHGNFYYYGGDYDQGDDHGQAEESVIRKVFEGMQGAEGEQAEEQRYAGDGGDAAVAGGTVTTYAGDVHGGQPYAPQGFGGGPALAYNGAGNYYNVEQANKYYSSSPSGRVESGPMHTAPAPNATAAAADGRVRYHEAAPAPAPAPAPADAAGGPSPSAQHITKKSDYYAYSSAGRVRYRDVGTGHVSAHLTNAPRVRFREVGSDTVHYSLSDQTSSEGGVEHGPRHVRVRRQTLDMADIGRKMADAHRQMAAEVADFADHAKKVSDKSVELGNEIEMLFAKKSAKPKKPAQAAKPVKMKKEGTDDDCDEQVTKSVMDEEEEDELSTSIMDPENLTDGPSDYESHVELVTGVPDHTSVEELAEQVQDDGVTNEFESEMPVYVRPTYASTEQVEADATTTTDAAEQHTTVPTGGAPDAAEATTVHSPTHAPPRPPPQSSIVDLLKQIAQLKIRLGIDFLKSTSRAFASYLDGLQRNMEDAIKQGSAAQYRRTGFWNYRRSKRDAKKTLNLKAKKSKSD